MEEVSIGRFLRKRRDELKLTQRQIAIHVGVTEAAVSRWESGEIANMRRDKIAKLAEVLEISPLVIMGAEGFIDKPPSLPHEQATLLSYFNDMNREGQTMALGLIKSLQVAHPKKISSSTAQNTFTNSGTFTNNGNFANGTFNGSNVNQNAQ